MGVQGVHGGSLVRQHNVQFRRDTFADRSGGAGNRVMDEARHKRSRFTDRRSIIRPVECRVSVRDAFSNVGTGLHRGVGASDWPGDVGSVEERVNRRTNHVGVAGRFVSVRLLLRDDCTA